MQLNGSERENSLIRRSSEEATATAVATGAHSLTSILPEALLNECLEGNGEAVFSQSPEIPSARTSSVGTNEIEKHESSIELQRLPSADINRRCWICYAYENDEDGLEDELVHPCSCKGSTKWVHQMCINQWMDEVQGGNASREIRCPYCTTFFSFEYPTPSLFIRFLSQVDLCHSAFCNTVMAGQPFSWLGFAVIAVNATDIFKQQLKEVLALLEECSDSMMQQLGLAVCLQVVVPSSLIILERHLPTLEDRLAHAIASSQSSATDVRALPPPPAENDVDNIDSLQQLIGVLLFPTIADTIGYYVYGSLIVSSFRRYLMGSLTFIICRGIIKVFYKRKQLSLRCKRKVKNKE